MANTMSAYGSNTNRPLSEIVGLSTDTKPTDSIEGIQIQNGSSFRELDTGKRFLFDAENTTWNEVSSGGGGGGSTLIEKSISANGVYNASDDSADGYSKVTVDVAGGGGETFEVILSSPDYIEWTADKNYAETLSAIENGDNVKFKVDIDVTVFDSPGYYLFTDDSNPENAKIIMVSLGSGYESSLMITMFVKWTSNDVITGVSLMEMSE